MIVAVGGSASALEPSLEAKQFSSHHKTIRGENMFSKGDSQEKI